MSVIVLTGKKRSGKDVIGKYLVENYGFVRYAFADPIREVCKVIFDWTDEYMKQYKEELDEFYGINPRQAMQWIGTEAFQFYISQDYPIFSEITGRTIWVKKFLRWYERTQPKRVVITDMRFHHELDTLEEYIGNDLTSVRVTRESTESNDTHASEQEIPDLNVDYEIDNDSTLEELYATIEELMDWKGIF